VERDKPTKIRIGWTNFAAVAMETKKWIIIQGSHYLQIRGRSDFSFRELTGRSGRQQREVGKEEINCD
jgi:hypothetical protein